MFGSPTIDRARRLRMAMEMMQRDPQTARALLQPAQAPMPAPPQQQPQQPQTQQAPPPLPAQPTPQAQPPAPPQAASDEIVVPGVTPPPRTPYDAGPLAMDRVGQPPPKPEMDWADRLQIFGATLQQMARPENQIANTVQGVRTTNRTRATEEERQRLAAAQLQGVRKILDDERLQWERIPDSADAPKTDWNATWVMQMARLAANPDEFLRLYAARREAEDDRGLKRDDMRLRGSQFDRELEQRGAQFDRGLASEEARAKQALGVDQYNAETARMRTKNETGVQSVLDRNRTGEAAAAADAGAETLRITARMRQILEEPGFKTGGQMWGGAGQNAGSDKMRALDDEFRALSESLAGSILRQYGANPTEGERDAALRRVPSLGLQPGANKALLDAIESQSNQKISEWQGYQDALSANPKLSGIDQWRRLQRAGSSAQPAPAALPRIRSDAEYDALPRGARFIDPEGVERVKP
jgi:hypothetical protein